MRAVLILTRSGDQHVPPVADEIRARGVRVFCCDLADFPEAVTMTTTLDPGGWSGTLLYQEQHLSLDSLISIWRRRPVPYKAPTTYAQGIRTFIEEEADRAFLGVLDSLFPYILWVSRTHSVRRAELKALQLAQAQQCGFRVPRTLITNTPDALTEFYDACQGNVVLKSVSRGTIEDEPHRIGRFIYTSKVEKADLDSLDGVRVTAHLLQEHIARSINIRVVVIGKQVFAVELHSPHLDFRQNYDDITYALHTLPGDIEQKVLALVRGFDVQFSSMDLLLTAQGEYVFLDLNPNGQWFFLQRHLQDRLPLKEAMADLLVSPKDYSL